MPKLEEVKIRDLAGLFGQYRPYLMTLIAILLIVVVLPLKKNIGEPDKPAGAITAPLVSEEQVVAEQPQSIVEQPPPVENIPFQAPFVQPGFNTPPPQSSIEPSQTSPSPQSSPSPSPSPGLGCFPGLGCQ